MKTAKIGPVGYPPKVMVRPVSQTPVTKAVRKRKQEAKKKEGNK